MAAARREQELADHIISGVTLVLFAIPGFWLAQLAILFPVLRWRLFPLQGMVDASPTAPTGLGHLADIGYHLILPAFVLAAAEVAAVARLVRSGLLSEGSRDYARVAAAKGLDEEAVVAHHVLRNALLPVVTLVGTRIGFVLSGAVVIESIFSWPGLGSVLRSALTTNLDPPLVLGIAVFTSVTVLAANLITDLAYTWVDPRVRLG
jgi:peptide/nickel transport system permease protein